MADSPVAPKTESPPSEPRRSRSSYVWRVLAIVAVLAVMAAMAHFLRGPGRSPEAAGTAADPWTGLVDPPRKPPEPDPTSPAAKAQAAGLRAQMAGILGNLAAEEGPYEEPANQTPEGRRDAIEKMFPLGPGNPPSAVPADLPTPGSEVIVVFPSPDNPAVSMIFLRIRKEVSEAMSDFQQQYTRAGWKLVEPVRPEAQKDSGWLMRFSQPGRERIVYARQRQSGKETLAAVYDSRY